MMKKHVLRLGYVALVVLPLATSCDEFPGREVIGVRLGSAGDEVEFVKPLCPGDRVTEVILQPAPEGVPRHDEEDILWKIHLDAGSTRSTYVMGETPSGFVEDIPLSEDLGPAQGLAATIDTQQDAAALVLFQIGELRTDEVLTPEGYVSPDAFQERSPERCSG
jgi:hypothetical protein